jgi:hypothetical protein
MSSTAWGIVGCVVCVGGYNLLRYGIGKSAGYVFAGVVITAGVILHFVYQHQLAKLRDGLDALPDDERGKALQEVDPEIADDLRSQNDKKHDA